jgi:integrase
VVELADRYLIFARGYYIRDGQPTRHLAEIKRALTRVKDVFGLMPAREFGPKALKALREELVEAGLSRPYVNAIVDRIRRMFKWGVAEELVPPTTYQALQALVGLKRGRTAAREPKPILPVADATVDATLPYLPAVVADMVRLQRLTGCRPGEVCQLRPCDVDRSGDVWTYRPARHKTDYRGRERVIYIGPKAQAILRHYLLRAADAYCFSPADSEAKRLEALHATRRTPLSCGNRPRPRRRTLGDRYSKEAYINAIKRGVRRANRKILDDATEAGVQDPALVSQWRPNQLRHSAASEIRKQYGLEAAQVILGHAKADITQVYAERDSQLAAAVALKIG